MIGVKSSASALPEHDPCAGDATGFAVAVTVGIGAIRLLKTCAKQGIAFWDYLGSRLEIAGQDAVPSLAELIRCRAGPASALRAVARGSAPHTGIGRSLLILFTFLPEPVKSGWD